MRDFADLSAALRSLYEDAGAPPLRIMEERAGEYGALPRSSAHRIVNKQTVPHSHQQFQAYLRACDVPPDRWKEWEDAWSRAWRYEKQEDAGLNESPRTAWEEPKMELSIWDHRAEHGKATGPQFLRPLAPRQRSQSPRLRRKALQKQKSHAATYQTLWNTRLPPTIGELPLFELRPTSDTAEPVDRGTLF